MEKEIRKIIKKALGNMNESYVTTTKKYDLNTEMLSEKSKDVIQSVFEDYSDKLNSISAELDVAVKEEANSNKSVYRSLKLDESHNINGTYLNALFLDNISDLQSVVSMDSLSFLRIERDFGNFDSWQDNFISCALSSRNGWAILAYSFPLKRYINVMLDDNDKGMQAATIPLLCLNMHEYVYFKDYMNNKKEYIYAMMKEINWEVVENRIKKIEKIAKII